MTSTEIFMKMVYWLIDNTEMENPTQVARKAGIDPVNITKIKNGTNKSVTQGLMRKVNNAFNKPFNPEWMRGNSDVMLLSDLSAVSSTSAPVPDGSPSGTSSPTPPDSLTAALLSAKDETIAALRTQLTEKDSRLADKDEVIATKDALIDTLQQQLATLRAQLTIEKGLSEEGGSFLSELVERRMARFDKLIKS